MSHLILTAEYMAATCSCVVDPLSLQAGVGPYMVASITVMTSPGISTHVLSTLQALEPELRAAGVRHISVFGSVARGEDTATSDVDLALDLAPEKTPPRFQFVADIELSSRSTASPGRRRAKHHSSLGMAAAAPDEPDVDVHHPGHAVVIFFSYFVFVVLFFILLLTIFMFVFFHLLGWLCSNC